jgi:hypothetical protein
MPTEERPHDNRMRVERTCIEGWERRRNVADDGGGRWAPWDARVRVGSMPKLAVDSMNALTSGRGWISAAAAPQLATLERE